MDSSEKFITASISSSLSFNSAVISSANIESASEIGAVTGSWGENGVASGMGVVAEGEASPAGLSELSVETSVAGIGLTIGERALLEGHVRLL